MIPTVSTTTTLAVRADTVGDVRAFLELAERLGVDAGTELRRGGDLRAAGFDRPLSPDGTALSTIGDVQVWLAQIGEFEIGDDTPIASGSPDLRVDVPVFGVELTRCGDCAAGPVDLLVRLHDDCREHWVPLPL